MASAAIVQTADAQGHGRQACADRLLTTPAQQRFQAATVVIRHTPIWYPLRLRRRTHRASIVCDHFVLAVPTRLRATSSAGNAEAEGVFLQVNETAAINLSYGEARLPRYDYCHGHSWRWPAANRPALQLWSRYN